jgi:hypothetical protein
MLPPARTRNAAAAGPRRCQSYLIVTAVFALGLVPPAAQPLQSETVSGPPVVASPGAKPPTTAQRVDPEVQRRAAEGSPSTRDSIAPELVADVAEPPMPRLKPQESDRSDDVIALLKHAVAVTAEPPTAKVEETTRLAIPEPPTPRLKPQALIHDPIMAHWKRVLGDASDSQSAPAAPEPPGGHPASGNEAPAETSVAASTSQDDAIEALQRELRARDSVIADLLQRVEQLERRSVLTDAQLDQAVAGAAPPRPGIGFASGDPADDAPETAPKPEAPSAEQVAAANQASAAPPAAPGQFEVDQDASDRALERTLVEQGVLLLPWGQAQIEPSFSYTRDVTDTPTFVTENGTTFVGEVQVRRNEFTSGQNLRVGLPFDAQAEIAVPYRYVDQSTVTKVGFGERSKSSGSGYGFGDISVGVAKTLLRENGGWWPDLVGRIRWDTDTGKSSDGNVPLGGGGFNEIAGSLNAVKRQDPLAFVAGVSYQRAFEHNNVRPGDELGFSIGTVLAASPETSLSLSFSQNFSDELEVDGRGVDGSDGVDGVLSIGAASILGRGFFVNTSVDIGLTDDAPDYAIHASVPIRFSLPGY